MQLASRASLLDSCTDGCRIESRSRRVFYCLQIIIFSASIIIIYFLNEKNLLLTSVHILWDMTSNIRTAPRLQPLTNSHTICRCVHDPSQISNAQLQWFISLRHQIKKLNINFIQPPCWWCFTFYKRKNNLPKTVYFSKMLPYII